MNIDKKLIKQAQKDIKKFDEIYLQYAEKIKNYLRPKVNNDEFIAEDLTSHTFEKAIKNIKNFRWQGASFSAWLYTIANNTLIDYYRKNKNKSDKSEDFYENIRDPAKLPEDLLIENDTKSTINTLLNTLPKRERVVLRMKFYEGYSNNTIAQKLNISETNVGTIIYRVTKKLKNVIEESQISL